MKSWLRATAIALVAATCGLASAQDAGSAAPPGPLSGQVDLARYLRRDVVDDIKISPDGRFYAAKVSLEDRSTLVVISRDGLKVLHQLPVQSWQAIVDFQWVSPERLVITTGFRNGSRALPGLAGSLVALNYDGSELKIVFGTTFSIESLRRPSKQGVLLDTLPGDDHHVLVQAYQPYSRKKAWVERVDVFTGVGTRVVDAPVARARFVTDARGVVRFASGAEEDNTLKVFHRANDSAPWTVFADQARNGELLYPLGLDAGGTAVFLQIERSDGTDEIVRHDLATGERVRVLRDPIVDPAAILRSSADPTLAVAVHFDGPEPRTAYFDEASAEAQRFRQLETAFPGKQVRMTSATRDGALALVAVSSDTQAGDYYLFDTRTMQATHVMSRRKWLDPATLAPTRPMRLQARDGLALHGFLTIPVGVQARALPMVVLPHGGPFGIYDTPAFDEEVQLLAAAGYAVLRVNFRGSGNYGQRFRQVGAQQWGRTMQDDLTDATRWAIAQGIADPERIGIYGGSYGGYAALMGVAREPGLYRCAVGYVGVYDLQKMVSRDAYGEASENWHGEWVGQRSSLGSVSPVTLAGRIKVPVFLAAGRGDEIAPIYHTEAMDRALRKAKVPVETLIFDNEGHGFSHDANRDQYYRQLLAFLARHLGGRSAQPQAPKPASGGAVANQAPGPA